MAQIKGITIEFSADMTKLNAGLKSANSALSKTQAELKSVNRALKFNPMNTTLLKQKFDLLKKTVSQTEEKLKVLRQQQAKMNSAGVDKTSAEYRKLEREIIKTENQLKKAQGDLRKFGSVGKQQALAVGTAFKTAGTKIKSAGRTITTSVSMYGGLAIYGGAKLIESANKQAEAEQKLAEIYKSRMGVGKKAVQSTLELASAEQKAGVVGDEVQIAAAQQLATYAKYPSTVNTMLPAINDLLVQQKGLNATQEDATGLANLFGKAMMGQTGALKRAGISFTKAQEEILKTGTEEEKAATIAEVVSQNVGDMNEAFAKTDAGKIQQAKNALGDMGEEIGAILLPAVADLVSWFQDNLMPKLQQFIDFMKEHPQIAKFALAFALITAALGPLLMLFGGLVTAIGGVITIVTTFGSVIGAVAAPVLGIVAAIAAAIAIGVLLYKNWDKIKKFASKTWNAIKKAITKVVDVIKTSVVKNFTTLKTNVIGAWTAIKTRVTAIVTAVKTAVSNAFNAVKTTVTNIVKAIRTAVATAFDAIKTKITAIVTAIKVAIHNGFTAIKTKVTTIVTAIKVAIHNGFTAIKTKITTIVTGIKTSVSNAFTTIKTKITTIVTGIKTAVSNAFTAIKTKVSTIVTAIKTKISDTFSAIKTKISTIVTAVKSKITGTFTAIKTKVSSIASSIKTAITSPFASAKEKVVSTINSIKEKVSSVFNGLKGTVSSVWNSIKSAITKPINTAKETVNSAIEKIKSVFPVKLGKIFSGVKLPHFKISGGKVPWGIGGKGTKPSVSIEWYKKAMTNPYMFSGATLFGAGESGDEILYGRSALLRDIASAIGNVNGTGTVINVYGTNNMDVNDLALAVEQRIITMQKRRTAAWA